MPNSRLLLGKSFVVLGAGVLIGYFLAKEPDHSAGRPPGFNGALAAEQGTAKGAGDYSTPRSSTNRLHLLQSPAAVATNRQETDFGLSRGDSP